MMAQLTIDVPDAFISLPKIEQEQLLQAALYQATQDMIERLEKDMTESVEQIARFETRYGLSFSQFEQELLPTLDSFEAHDDYNDWFFWQTVLNDKQQLLKQLQPIGNGC